MLYQKRNFLVDAIQWFAAGDHPAVEYGETGQGIMTPDGWRSVSTGDWILTDAEGISYPMSNLVFVNLYEPCTELGQACQAAKHRASE
ncbi:hypothetical protein [Burkholderia pyrrocinia]|uniref:hypothetical protein n=1 Tax=Burkholderia pyrrocinia TaxID=60550 RepID=UPI00158E3A4C|nr:hypothetical protein [Burkholderia pyrrocinia]